MTESTYDYGYLSPIHELYADATDIHEYQSKVSEKARQRLDRIDFIAGIGSDEALLALLDWRRKQAATMKAFYWMSRLHDAAGDTW